jgi:hypothetical protein
MGSRIIDKSTDNLDCYDDYPTFSIIDPISYIVSGIFIVILTNLRYYIFGSVWYPCSSNLVIPKILRFDSDDVQP